MGLELEWTFGAGKWLVGCGGFEMEGWKGETGAQPGGVGSGGYVDGECKKHEAVSIFGMGTLLSFI